MDYKRKYETQMRINNHLKQEMENLRLSMGEITDERDALLSKVQKYQIQLEVLENYQKELKEEIDKAKEIQQQYITSMKDAKSVCKKYKGKMKSFLKETKRIFKRKVL